MEVLDDLQRSLFDALYTYRIPVAVGSIIAGALLLVVAWRFGWLEKARRHPARTGALLVLLLAIGLPLGYYTASPLFIRTELIEPDPLVEVVVPPGSAASAAPSRAPDPTGLADPSAQATESSSTPTSEPSAAPSTEPSAASTSEPGAAPTSEPSAAPTSEPSAAPTSFAPRLVSTGEFEGTDEFHFGSGTASIIETAPGEYRLRLADFSVRNGPDLFVYLSPSKDDYTRDSVELGRLKATDGSFSYALPPGADPSDFGSALIWCKQFSHLFAFAPLKGA